MFVRKAQFGYILMVSKGAKIDDKDVVVVGLGYVGLTLAAHLSNIGFNVHGVEIRRSVLDLLTEMKSFFWEPNLDEIISRTIASGTFTFSENLPVSQSNRVFIITVGTPLDASGKANLNPIINASKQVAEVLLDGDLVILRSTVKLGTTEQIVRPILAKKNKVFDLAFCPERTLEGSALQELGNLPQIIGAQSFQTRERAAKFFGHSTSSVIMVPDSKTAEMIKLVDNMQRDAHFAISNEIAEMCNNSGIRAQDVVNLGKLGYPRTNLASPGPVGGPCLEKDSYILAESFSDVPGLGQVAIDARKTNENVIRSGSKFVSKFLNSLSRQESIKVAVLGLAFKGKPETDDLRGSPSIAFIEALRIDFPNSEILVWDPMVHTLEGEKLPFKLARDLEHAVSNASALVLMNNHPKLDGLDIFQLSSSMSENSLIYDFWDRYSHAILKNTRTKYCGWGNHRDITLEVNF